MRLLNQKTRMNRKRIQRLMDKYGLICPILKVYLSVIKDAYTKQVMVYVVSESLAVDFVIETVNVLMQDHGIPLNEDIILHSDQGCHYTSISFRQLLKDKKLCYYVQVRQLLGEMLQKNHFSVI